MKKLIGTLAIIVSHASSASGQGMDIVRMPPSGSPTEPTGGKNGDQTEASLGAAKSLRDDATALRETASQSQQPEEKAQLNEQADRSQRASEIATGRAIDSSESMNRGTGYNPK